MTIKKRLTDFLKKIFALERFEFEKIIMDAEVIYNICELAKQAHPKEFISFLEGKVKDRVLYIRGLMYQEYYASEEATVTKVFFPLNTDVVGSVHSHPGPDNRPSRADLSFFSKQGMIHLIIKKPYAESDIQAYSMNGEKIRYEVA